jgi:uncharacterized protein
MISSREKVSKSLLKEIVDRVVAAAHPLKIILFGSCARNEMHRYSDLDLLIVEKNLQNKGKEMVRLRNVIGNVGLGVDVLVYSQEEIEDWGHLPGTALYEALREGKVIYEASR